MLPCEHKCQKFQVQSSEWSNTQHKHRLSQKSLYINKFREFKTTLKWLHDYDLFSFNTYWALFDYLISIQYFITCYLSTTFILNCPLYFFVLNCKSVITTEGITCRGKQVSGSEGFEGTICSSSSKKKKTFHHLKTLYCFIVKN